MNENQKAITAVATIAIGVLMVGTVAAINIKHRIDARRITRATEKFLKDMAAYNAAYEDLGTDPTDEQLANLFKLRDSAFDGK